jgi:hypothetical protein
MDYRTNTEILKELNISSFLEKKNRRLQKKLDTRCRMNVLYDVSQDYKNYTAKGRRNQGGEFKRILDV